MEEKRRPKKSGRFLHKETPPAITGGKFVFLHCLWQSGRRAGRGGRFGAEPPDRGCLRGGAGQHALSRGDRARACAFPGSAQAPGLALRQGRGGRERAQQRDGPAG